MAMRAEIREMYAATKALHKLIVESCMTTREATKSCADTADLADLAYACRKSVEFLTEAQKQVRQLGALAERLAATLHVATAVGERSIHTPYVTATPHVRTTVSLPKAGTPAYGQMMDFFGVPRHLWENREHALVRDHWPGIVDEVSRLMAEGKPTPPGVDPSKSYAEYTLHLVGRRGPDEQA